MTRQQTINQLHSLLIEARRNDEAHEDDIFAADVEALERAIAIIEITKE